MCGIAGFISNEGKAVPVSLIQKMTDAVTHRGPDGAGIWRQGNLALGHRRLSILDLSDLGHQPMVDADSGCVISFNGEIYNYIEIRQQLSGLGYQFRSNTDTEVILKSYDHWGENCVDQFNGMWAFAIHDPHNNILFCSRDRFGVKPFYYAEPSDGFAFGSEIRQLLPLLPGVVADAGVLFGFLVARIAEDPERTFYSGIRKLPGGHNLIFNLANGKFSIKRYYSLQAKAEYAKLDMDSALETFNRLFFDAIRLRLRSDVRVGTCLSGGMDSSSIATLAAELYGKDRTPSFAGITAISEDPATDESVFAKRIVDSSGLDWITVRPGYDDFCKMINPVVRAQEEPFASASVLMQYFVMQESRRAGIPVLLDGQGGDETLLGYDRYFADHFLQSLTGGQMNQAFGILSGLHQNGRRGALGILLRNLLYFHAPMLRRLAIRRQLSLFRSSYKPMIRKAHTAGREYGDLFGMQKQEIERTNLPVLLRYEDKNSMANSIETRLPFLDYRLVEFATSVATNIKLHDGWGKYLLRKSMDTKMPDDIVWRKHKFGFEAPEARWMKKHDAIIRDALGSSDLLNEICVVPAQKMDTAGRLKSGMRWRLYSVALWAREFDIKGLSGGVE
jgi:asparagine synthase (glutamine-hydrolysing)